MTDEHYLTIAQLAGATGIAALALLLLYAAYTALRGVLRAGHDGLARGVNRLRRTRTRTRIVVMSAAIAFACLWIAADERNETISRGQWRLLGASAAVVAAASWYTAE